MSEGAEIFSLRIVVADFYLEKPLLGLDPCYSEFRANPIKKVPIIRIFGSNRDGQKTCMHVHGVFPYFYIPYESKDFESINKAIYQVALSIDKAINISLGQTQSATQHVFKIQLVKGIPFYGYHRREHQFLKIYMYNPRFVRRAASLLQNGSILGKVFHPHESHVPYVLQFMIDYNLYGMSFLHIPLDIVKFRRNSEEDEIAFTGPFKDAQILSTMLVKKQSCSALEVDIGASFILNRFQLAAQSNDSQHSNPGVEAIWHDEEIRRRNLITSFGDDEERVNAIPKLAIPTPDERPNLQPTESETFYRVGLVSQLATLESALSESGSMLDQTLNNTMASVGGNATLSVGNMSNKEMRRTFNLKKLLVNSVYPEECPPDEELENASCIKDHLSGNSFFQTNSSSKSSQTLIFGSENPAGLDESNLLDATMVDEDILLSLTQKPHVALNATLRAEDMELLDVLQQLEVQNEFDNPVDLDSTLAPLSQSKDFEHTPELVDTESVSMANSHVLADDSASGNEFDDHMLDFSIALDDIDELLLKLSQPKPEEKSNGAKEDSPLPQTDGADDPMPKTPEKRLNKNGSPRTPKHTLRSPRTPKSSAASKYAPLPFVITNRSASEKKNEEKTGLRRLDFDSANARPSSPVPLRKSLALTKMRRKTISSAKELQGLLNPVEAEEEEQKKKSKSAGRRSRKNSVDLDRTHVTCSLTPIRRSERLLKFCRSDSTSSDKAQKKTLPNSATKTKKQKPERERQKKTPARSTDSKGKVARSKNIHGLKKLLVRLPKRDLHTLAEELKRSKEELSKNLETNRRVHEGKVEEEVEEKVEEEIEEEVKEKGIENDGKLVKQQTEVEELITSRVEEPEPKDSVSENVRNDSEDKEAADAIRRNLEQLMKAFQTSTERNGAQDHEAKSEKVPSSTPASKGSSLRFFKSKSSNLFGDPKRSPLSLNRYRSKKNENGKPTSEDNIRRNLVELAKVLEGTNERKEEEEEEGRKSIPEECEERVEEELNNTCDTSFATLRLSESDPGEDEEDGDREGDDDEEEEIAASDTEATTETESRKMKASSCRSFRSKRVLHNPPKDTPAEFPQTPSMSANNSQSFFDLSLSINSPSVFSEISSPAQTPKTARPPQRAEVAILEPLLRPPTREETLISCEKLQIYEHEFQAPFYSNPDDLTKAIEVGFTVLQIPSNKLSDCSEFQSVFGEDFRGLADWRRGKLVEMGDGEILQRHHRNPERVREFLATKKPILIQPQIQPPTRHDAKVWLKAKELLQKGDPERPQSTLHIDQDSPIKVRRQKVTMMFNDEAVGGGGGDGDDMDETGFSLTLTPATPLRRSDELNSASKEDSTPRTTAPKEVAEVSSTSRKRKRRTMRMKLVRTSLSEKLKAAADGAEPNGCEVKLRRNALGNSEEMIDSLTSSQHSNLSSNDSSSVSSQVALAELERISFLKNLKSDVRKDGLNVSFGLSSASLNNTFGFKVNFENLHEAKADLECNNLTSIAMELFVTTREDLYPDPQFDEIRCIFYAIENNISMNSASESESSPQIPDRKACGYILVNDTEEDVVAVVRREGKVHGIDADIDVKIVRTEVDALEAWLELCAHWDADVFAGYEIEMSSWGYLIDRAKHLCLNIAPLLSRVPTQKVRDFADDDQDQLTDLDVETKLCGRILLDVWRLMRSEIALTSYTFENVMYHILHKRCPMHSHRELTNWFRSPSSRWIVLEYYLERVRGIMAILDQLDLLGRTSEMAKLIGIQFYEVLSRGSQFRVESMMLRIAKPRNLVPLSPSVQQRAHMRAPEYLPLILEPQSRFYADPLIVLDFQSLYPSMIIAYNYCFSTCLGRVEHLGHSTPFEFGASQLRVSPTMLRKLLDEDLVTISPCGVVFVKSSVREGILPRMLTEILDTRLMVKQSMKLHKSNSALQRILHSRQLGLKLMANVTYGYTAANFSGRMPAVEVGDSVVAKGRETLERTIKMVEANEKWGVKVVYGDTDSLFVLVPGRSREQAFKIGEEIAAAATNENPFPVKLKLEKVYQPCILQTKKRYVGYMYESPDQSEPVYEAKGIETVRRDGCPAVAKMLEKVLRILFETADVSQVKQYVCRQFTKLLSGRANLQDLIFAKEFRGLNGYRPTACVPALELTRKWIQTDPRHIPRRGERVPFIITNGPPGVPLIRLVRSPHDVLADEGLKINAIYYITKAIIPPLNRCLLLIGADVNEWFTNLPRKILMTTALSTANEVIATNQQKKSTISQYFSTTSCVIECGRQTKEGVCHVCVKDTAKCVLALHHKIAKIERAFHLTQHICQACCGRVGDLKCASLDCPVLYVLEVKRRDLPQIEHLRRLLAKF